MIRQSLLLTMTYRAAREYRRRLLLRRIVVRSKLKYCHLDPNVGEVRARDLLSRAERHCPWVKHTPFPAGGAAGPLLLYLLIRALDELPIGRALDIGAGETTRLLRDKGVDTITLEHDPAWATRLGVPQTPLTTIDAPDGTTDWYDSKIVPGFNLIVVDGPVGCDRWSRYGIVKHVPEWCLSDWALLWDDLDRPGDLESFGALIEKLRSVGAEHDHVLLQGDRTVGLVYSPAFAALRHMW